MTIAQALASSGISRLDAEVLLAKILKRNRAWLLAHGDESLGEVATRTWHDWRARRSRGEPVAYITGEKEFFGRMFEVNRSVLIPRPATEGMIEAALKFLKNGRNFVQKIDAGIVAVGRAFSKFNGKEILVDIGTGSGCIAVTLALELPERIIIATDISLQTLETARRNAVCYGVADRMQCRTGDGLNAVDDIDRPFIIISNPPYIPDGQALMRDVAAYEPTQALFAGPDGLAVIGPLVRAAKAHPNCSGILLECREDQCGIV